MNERTKTTLESTVKQLFTNAPDESTFKDISDEVAKDHEYAGVLHEQLRKAISARKQCLDAIDALQKTPLANGNGLVVECCHVLSETADEQARLLSQLKTRIKETENRLSNNDVALCWVRTHVKACAVFSAFLKIEASRCKPILRDLIRLVKTELRQMRDAIPIYRKYHNELVIQADNHHRYIALTLGILSAADTCTDEEFAMRLKSVNAILTGSSHTGGQA